MNEITQEYIDDSIKKANGIYDEIVGKAKSNGVIYVEWVMRTFSVNWYGASYVIERMEDEGLCGSWQKEGYRKMF
ncbi:hypothetical protein [Paenibacillus sp. LK1]|uniref:hypothetical protein n=1 Tax=Paenibacillus sp. LK1 TaxID=2053014 RepID=UPI000C17B586|nr:hypothetical protein [Paenibacillus sp. LK1]PIH59095.1 hypothetical protein CS562_14235 [Paenibacillus sp. LK1]